MGKSKDSLRKALRRWLEGAGKVVVVGVGNELRRDDFVGMKIVKDLKDFVPERVMLVESETVPESFMDTIIKFNPTHILIIDAGLLGLEPGNLRLVESTEAVDSPTTAISTHALPLRIFCEYLTNTIGAKIALIIIQPKRTDFGEGLSMEVERAVENLEKTLVGILTTL